MKKIFTCLLACALAALAQSASASIITHGSGGTYTENNGLYIDSYSDFDRAEFMFASEYVDTITIAHAANGYTHDHGTGAPAKLEVYNGTNWLTVFSAPASSDTYLSAMFAAPVTFAGMNISGLRLNTDEYVGYAFHNIDAGMTYEMSGTAPNNVPEPGSIALLGLGFAGMAALRRRKGAAA